MNDIANNTCNNEGILKATQIIFYFETTNVPYIEHIEYKCTQNSKYTLQICMLFVHPMMNEEWKCGIYTLKLYLAMKKKKVCR